MSDINVAPSSTEPAVAGDNVNATEVQTRAQEVGASTVGESGSTPVDGSPISATSTESQSTSANIATGTMAAAGSFGSTDAPAVAASGESLAGSLNADTGLTPSPATGDAVSATSENPTSTESSSQTAAASGTATTSIMDTTTGTTDDPNAGASPAAGQSASDTASSAQVASLGGDTAADASRDDAAMRERVAINQIAELQTALAAARSEAATWRDRYNAAAFAKPHAESILQKLEAGEAIVMGDLQSRLRAVVEAL